MNFTSSQKNAITSDAKDLLLISCAGSGKTTVLIEKVRHLLAHRTFPETILVLTFSVNAALNFKKRLLELENKQVDVEIRTFHSLARKIIVDYQKKHLDKVEFEIIDEGDRKRFAKTICNTLVLSSAHYQEFIDNLSKYKTGIKDVPPHLWQLFNEYQMKLENLKKIELDDLITLATKHLDDDKDLCNYYQEKYTYLFLDEFKDTNDQQLT